MKKVFGSIFLGIGFFMSLLFLIEIADEKPYYISGTFFDYFIFPTISVIVPICIGLFLIRKKEQVNSVGQNVKYKDKYFSLVVFASIGLGASIVLLLLLLLHVLIPHH